MSQVAFAPLELKPEFWVSSRSRIFLGLPMEHEAFREELYATLVPDPAYPQMFHLLPGFRNPFQQLGFSDDLAGIRFMRDHDLLADILKISERGRIILKPIIMAYLRVNSRSDLHIVKLGDQFQLWNKNSLARCKEQLYEELSGDPARQILERLQLPEPSLRKVA